MLDTVIYRQDKRLVSLLLLLLGWTRVTQARVGSTRYGKKMYESRIKCTKVVCFLMCYVEATTDSNPWKPANALFVHTRGQPVTKTGALCPPVLLPAGCLLRIRHSPRLWVAYRHTKKLKPREMICGWVFGIMSHTSWKPTANVKLQIFLEIDVLARTVFECVFLAQVRCWRSQRDCGVCRVWVFAGWIHGGECWNNSRRGGLPIRREVVCFP